MELSSFYFVKMSPKNFCNEDVVLVAQGFIESCCSRTLWMCLALGDVAGDNRSGFCYLSEVL